MCVGVSLMYKVQNTILPVLVSPSVAVKCQASDGTQGWPLVLPGGHAPPWQTSYQAPETSPALGGEGKGTGRPSSPSAGRWWDPLGCSSEVGALLYFEVHRKVAGRHRAWGLQGLRARLLPRSGRLLLGTSPRGRTDPAGRWCPRGSRG